MTKLITRNEVEVFNQIDDNDLKKIKDFIYSVLEGECLSLYGMEFEFVDEGSFGRVYKYKSYAIKIAKNVCEDCMEIECECFCDYYSGVTLWNDISHMKKLQGLKSIPTLYMSIGNLAMVSEFIEGHRVDKFIREDRVAPNLNHNEMIDSFLTVVESMRDKNILPYDIHSQNVMLDTKNNRMVIVDVGAFSNASDSYIKRMRDYEDIKYSYPYSEVYLVSERLRGYFDKM